MAGSLLDDLMGSSTKKSLEYQKLRHKNQVAPCVKRIIETYQRHSMVNLDGLVTEVVTELMAHDRMKLPSGVTERLYTRLLDGGLLKKKSGGDMSKKSFYVYLHNMRVKITKTLKEFGDASHYT